MSTAISLKMTTSTKGNDMKTILSKEDLVEKVSADLNKSVAVNPDMSDDQGVTYNEGNGVQDTIVMTGPLSEIYTRALGIYFAKKPLEIEGEVSQESQSMDVAVNTKTISESVGQALSGIAEVVELKSTSDEVTGNVAGTVFSVDHTKMNTPEVIDAMDKLKERCDKNGGSYVMLVNVEPLKPVEGVFYGTNSTMLAGLGDLNVVNAGQKFNRATECYCETQGHPVVYGVEGLAVWMVEKFEGKAKANKVAQEAFASEGFMDMIKGLFNRKKKEDHRLKENQYSSLDFTSKPLKQWLELFMNKEWVQDNCSVVETSALPNDFFKTIDNIEKCSSWLEVMDKEVDSINGRNLKVLMDGENAGLELGSYDSKFTSISKVVKQKYQSLPKNLGLGFTIQLEESKNDSYGVAINLDSSKAFDITKVKLTADDIVFLAKQLSNLYGTKNLLSYPGQSWEYENELEIHFKIKWKNKDDETAEAMLSEHNQDYYLSVQETGDVFPFVFDVSSLLQNYLRVLNNSLKTAKLSTADGDHEYR